MICCDERYCSRSCVRNCSRIDRTRVLLAWSIPSPTMGTTKGPPFSIPRAIPSLSRSQGEFIYNSAREIGRSDSRRFSERLGLTDGLDRLSSGPVHFAHAGWALVDILDDSAPAMDDSYYLHYYHPNTFESETLKQRGRTLSSCGCLFSAGYSAGWCSDAFHVEVHGREIRCLSRGDSICEFIMAPIARLDAHDARLRGVQG